MKKNPELKSKVVFRDRIITPNPETGEFTEEVFEKKTHLVLEEKDFYLMYSSMLGVLLNAELSRASLKVWAYLAKNYQAGQPIGIGKPVKDRIIKEAKMSLPTIDKSLGELSKSHNGYSPLLIKDGHGYYILNPQYLWKGNNTSRREVLTIMLENHKEQYNNLEFCNSEIVNKFENSKLNN